jgi:uncharacterized Zn finger protein (UPF0148 family)
MEGAMNHTCLGDIFERWGKKWGRCFGGSSMFEIREGMIYCPACGRPWDGMADRGDWDPDESDDVKLQIDLPQLKFMLEEKSKRVKQLEADLELWKKMYHDRAGAERSA